MNIIPDKPFKTYDEQIDILINNYGLTIRDKSFAIQALQSLTYYDLINGYKECFLDPKTERYQVGTTLESIYIFAILDKNVQSTIFEFSAIIENSFKTKIAYVLSKHFGVEVNNYLNENNFYKSNGAITFSSVKQKCIDVYQNNTKMQQPSKHYSKNHNHIPAWILFKNVSFSNIINLYQLLKQPEKTAVTEIILPNNNISYDEKVAFILASVNIVRTFRNKIAHNLKFVTYKSKNKLSRNTLCKITSNLLITEAESKNHSRGIDDIYADILCIFHLLREPVLQFMFINQLRAHLAFFNKAQTGSAASYSDYLQVTNLPANIMNRLEKMADSISGTNVGS